MIRQERNKIIQEGKDAENALLTLTIMLWLFIIIVSILGITGVID